MTGQTALRLARASNLPTVGSNVLVGVALVGAYVPVWSVALVVLAVAAMYCGGMFLNDACDHRFDAEHRPERPIPRGEAGLIEVWAIGVGLLIGGAAVCVVVAAVLEHDVVLVMVMGAALCAAILYYDVSHRTNPVASWVMGTCRGLVYALAGVTLGAGVDGEMLIAAATVCTYVAGLTAVARFEVTSGRPPRWAKFLVWLPWLVYAPRVGLTWSIGFAGMGAAYLLDTLGELERGTRDVGAAVARLVAAISLVDAVILAAFGCHGLATLAALALLLSRRWQRSIPGS